MIFRRTHGGSLGVIQLKEKGMRNKWLLLTSLAALAACKAGDKPVDDPNESSLSGTKWVLSHTEDFAGVPVNLGTALYSLEFDESGTVTGMADCNRINGSYEGDEDNLSIAVTTSTKVKCEHPYSEVYTRELQDAKITELTSSTMIIHSKTTSNDLHFKQAAAGCGSPIEVADNIQSPIVLDVKENIDWEILIPQLEAEYPDFTVLRERHCTPFVTAEVNPNTLAELRCHDDIAAIHSAAE